MARISALTAAALGLGLSLAGPEALAADVIGACSGDIENHCMDVEPGDGRLVACLYAHEDQLSDECDATVAEMADLLDLFFERVRHVTQECGEDIRTHCAGVAVGEGRIFACLKDQGAAISAGCTAVLDQVSLELAD
ncbi:hypothetical protein LNKW23_07690 [Paralimibaculum aggregatum]|uniref:Cysteine rich repeat protein n=1 Tax=Paralimibaculum aggregatum TaxID=3036245 RepID=A0ABQ6LDY2_9RHOB|nr:cysteine rich repeat-containing protein [Limibaculum sp. NKW23]GMG81556.1 hypothetical protein LNKW23_07690 [Limibaculum sp. NKW23]